MISIFWLILTALMLIIEVATLGLTTIWFAAGALLAFIAALLNVPTVIQIILFVVSSIILLVSTRPIATKYLNAKTTKTNAESLVGQTAKVTERIDNLSSQGLVYINGLTWTARSTEDARIIENGTVVRVAGISGVKLIVEEIQEEAV